MDANGTRFWQLADGPAFARLSHLRWDAGCRVLRLASERRLVPALAADEARALAQAALAQPSRAVDAFECVAVWDAAESAVVVRSHLPGDLRLLPLAAAPLDLAVGAHGVLLVATADGLQLHDLRARWADTPVALAGFTPGRVAPWAQAPGAAAAADGAWLLEPASGRIARLTGRPLRRESPQPDDYAPQVFRPAPENAAAPAIEEVPGPPLAPGEVAVAIAAGPTGALVLLSWQDSDSGLARLHRRDAGDGSWQPPLVLEGADFAYAVAWCGADELLLRVPGLPDAPAYDLAAADAAGRVPPLGRIHPLAAGAADEPPALEAPFANAAFGLLAQPAVPAGPRGVRLLHPLSLNRLARRGEAAHFAGEDPDFRAWLIDSGRLDTVWHRLMAEAAIPVHGGFVALLAATQEPRPPAASDRHAWHAHGFGADIAALDEAMADPQLPRASWERAASEVAGHPGLLGGARVPGRRGLFGVLIQNSRQRVRNLVGRYLWIRLVLHGDGRSTPEIAALRAWGGRFSYAEHYLPRLYREGLAGAAAEAPGERLGELAAGFAAALDDGDAVPEPLREALRPLGADCSALAQVVVEQGARRWLLRDGRRAWRLVLENPDDAPPRLAVYRPQASQADFTARLLANVEGVMTGLEDRIAAAHLLSDPQAVPEPQLDWLAAWVGVAFDAALPPAVRRAWLAAAPALAQAHGTRRGLALALDIASGGGVRDGRLVVIESFRLRRVLGTLLGVDLVDASDPLLPGLQVSGNSVVGDTLVLADTERAELVALFRDDEAASADDAIALDFHARLAHRALVLVHGDAAPELIALARRIARLAAPAHVQVQVAAATWPLMVGVASLVGVDTHLGPPRPPRPVQVQRSLLGASDFLIGPAALDPRLVGRPGPFALAAPPAG